MAVEEQTLYNTTEPVAPDYRRVGQRLTISNRLVSKLGFWFHRQSYPTGILVFEIYRKSNEELLASKLWGNAIDVPSGLPPTYLEVEFDEPVLIDDEVYICAYSTGTSASDFPIMHRQYPSVKPNEGYVQKNGTWEEDDRLDTAYRYTYIIPPLDIATTPATGVIYNLAILTSELTDDGGEACDVRFQWGETDAYGNDTPWQAGNNTGDIIIQEIGGLLENTLYHFRAQGRNSGGTVNGYDLTFRTAKAAVGRGYALSRKLHIKRTTDVLDKASIAASEITTLADCRGINLVEVPFSLTLTVEATYDGSAAQGIKVHVRTSLTDRATGAHTGADGAAALTDAEAHFVVDELIGLTIKNLTDGSSGVITDNTATGVTATLAGGTNNDWDNGDAYIIEGAGYDTEDWDSFVPTFGAGSSIRQTEHYDVDPVYVKVLVENLDGAEAVTDVKIIMAVGT